MPDSLLHTLGRLHIVLLHLPIGLLLGVAAWELWRAWFGRKRAIELGASALFFAWLSVLGSGMAIGTGLLHELELADQADAIWLHKWLGIAAGVMSLLTAMLATAARTGRRKTLTRAYRVVLLLTIGVLIPAGHFGGELTHGEGYVLEPLLRRPSAGGAGGNGESENGTPGAINGANNASADGGGLAGANLSEAKRAALASRAREILAARCAGCHGSPRVRGGLRLDTTEAMLRGGNTGPALVLGDPAASLMMQRMLLALDHEDHMPPADRPQPTTDDLATIEAWIRGLQTNPTAPPSLAPPAAGTTPPVPAEIDRPAIDNLLERDILTQRLWPDSTLIRVDCSTFPALTDDDALDLLVPLAPNIAELSLAGTAITDRTIAALASMPHLTRLNLTATAITDQCAQRLAAIPSLEHLTVTGTALSADALDWLSFARPELTIKTDGTD